MLNQWRMPWWHKAILYIVVVVRFVMEAVVSFSWLAMPAVALFLIVKLTPFFLGLR